MRLIPTVGTGPDVRHEPSFNDPRSTAGASPLAIGEMLLRDGKLSAHDVQHVLAFQEKNGLRFGEAAVKLKLIKSKDLERTLSSQFSHPYGAFDDSGLARELAAAYKPTSRQVELLRQQRSLLGQRWFAEHAALAVVSPENREGRSYFTANLALLFAQHGRPTLLIDADMRRPRQHTLFGTPNRLGLSSVLAGRVPVNQAVQNISAIDTLAILPAGPIPPNPLELLDRGGLADALKELSRQFSVILVDTPAGDRHGDASVVAHCCRGALMLLRCHRTRLRDAQNFATRLSRADAQIVGTVMNRY